MENVKIEVKGSILTATVDLSTNSGKSKSGKSIVIGSTKGNQSIKGQEGVKIGLNVYKLIEQPSA